MKRIDSYYRFTKDPKTKTKYCCSNGIGDYGRLEILRNQYDDISMYLVSSNYTRATHESEFKLTSKGVHISRVIQCKVNKQIAYGDYRHTNDLLIFIFNDDKTEFELIIAQGKKYECNLYLNMLFDGVLDTEIEELRNTNNDSKKVA